MQLVLRLLHGRCRSVQRVLETVALLMITMLVTAHCDSKESATVSSKNKFNKAISCVASSAHLLHVSYMTKPGN